jgi:uncharacterized Zn finger protein (UPF0148 family)
MVTLTFLELNISHTLLMQGAQLFRNNFQVGCCLLENAHKIENMLKSAKEAAKQNEEYQLLNSARDDYAKKEAELSDEQKEAALKDMQASFKEALSFERDMLNKEYSFEAFKLPLKNLPSIDVEIKGINNFELMKAIVKLGILEN